MAGCTASTASSITAHVKHQGKEFDFTCALFRIHPKTREFQLFCEGTSNPWGVAWDSEGSAFISACVIRPPLAPDRNRLLPSPGRGLSAVYLEARLHRQAQAPEGGLLRHPLLRQRRLSAGVPRQVVHGQHSRRCINSDELTRDGSTYFGKPRPDFLTANDKWFMPVVQKDRAGRLPLHSRLVRSLSLLPGCRRDPEGIDRERGRLYRVVYKDYKPAGKLDLAKESDEQLIERLHSPNVWFRDLAQRLLTERHSPEVQSKLLDLVNDAKASHKARMHALWSLTSLEKLNTYQHEPLLTHQDPGVRRLGRSRRRQLRQGLAGTPCHGSVDGHDPSPDVRLQVAIAARKIEGVDALPVLLEVFEELGRRQADPGDHLAEPASAAGGEKRGLVQHLERLDLKKERPAGQPDAARDRAHPGPSAAQYGSAGENCLHC